MPDTRTYTPFFLSALLLVAGVVLLFPFCQYYIDPDGTAYLTIAQRYAAGDFAKAINGYWSPWSCWLAAIGIKAGLQPIPASIVVNVIGGAGMLYITQSLFIKFGLQRSLQQLLGCTLALYLCYAVYKQTFADLWECFFLLASLRIMLSRGYMQRPGLWVLNGIVGTLAYFAKAYAFPFFILNTLCCGFYMAGAWQKENRWQWLKAFAIAILVLLLCSSPWLYLLHDKYGMWMTSTAGKLNASWYLVGHPYWKEGISALLPPVYPDSPYYWEDPYMVNGDTPHFWSSFKLFALQIVRACLNLLKLVNSMNELSAFFLFTWLLAVAIMLSARVRYFFGQQSPALALSFLLFPLGFVIINYEARYIWYMLPLSMVIGGLALQRVLLLAEGHRALQVLVAVVFAGSYLVWPVWDMKGIAGQGREEYEMAQQLKKLGMKGGFTTALPHGPHTQKLARLAYFSGNSYYMMPDATTTQAGLLADMRRYGVKYYIQYPLQAGAPTLTDEQGRPFPGLVNNSLQGIKVFIVNP